MSLKDLREEAGLSQRELGELLAKSVPGDGEPEYYQPRISSYETGRNSMSLTVALALVAILNKELKKAKSKRVATVEGLLAEVPKKKPRR